MRVLHVVTQPWSETEGIARACRALVAQLDVDSHIVTEGPWYRFGPAIRDLDPDVVHLHGGTLAPLLAHAPVLRGRALVATCYGLPDRGPGTGVHLRGREPNVSALRVALYASGGRRFAQAALRSGRLGALCTPDTRIAATFTGAVLARGGAPVSHRRAAWSDTPTVAFAGRAQATRGLDDLVAAFPRVVDAIPNARLRLALLPSREATRWSTTLQRTSWADVAIGATDLDEVFAQCQVGAFPFHSATTITPALTAAEAMAVGLPIVASEVACLAPLVVPGRNGALIAPGDTVALAAALIEVLRGPEVWQPLSEGARKTIEEDWSWADAAAATRHAYEIAIKRCQR